MWHRGGFEQAKGSCVIFSIQTDIFGRQIGCPEPSRCFPRPQGQDNRHIALACHPLRYSSRIECNRRSAIIQERTIQFEPDLAWIELDSRIRYGDALDSVVISGEQVVQNECATNVSLLIRAHDGRGAKGRVPPYWVIYAAQLYADRQISFPDTGVQKVIDGTESMEDIYFTEIALPDMCGHDEFELKLYLPADYRHLAGYYGMIKRLDEALGRLLDALRSLNMLDNTVVLFTSDHGSHFKTRNGEYKRSCHESSVRVPTAFQGPGFDGGGMVHQLVSLIDLPLTLLDAAGIDVPAEMPGRSLLALLHGDPVDWPDDVFIQISESQIGRAVRTHRWKYSVSAPAANGWADAASSGYTEEFLYDLQSDPYELNNLIGWDSHTDVAETMRERLLRHIQAAGETKPVISPAPVRYASQLSVRPDEVQS